MNELTWVYGTLGLIAVTFLTKVIRRRFDPFDPMWLFFAGYFQVYVIQALSYHDWAVERHGHELVDAANLRAFWALGWFIAVYHLPIGPALARISPSAPRSWSIPAVLALTPILIFFGLVAAIVTRNLADGAQDYESSIFHQFHFAMLVGAVLLIVSGRYGPVVNRPLYPIGLATGGIYLLLWLFNGKRSHTLLCVLSCICAIYTSKQRRPGFLALAVTAVLGVLTVTVAIGWRGNMRYERNFSGFAQYIIEFDPENMLANLNLKEEDEGETRPELMSKETEEYGGFLVMMAAVPALSSYDYGQSYLRVFSTYIPRFLWPTKPYYGRAEWVSAWIAGSEFERDETFTGPAISILGATQLNGGAVATLVVLAVLAIALRWAYSYFLLYASTPWAQFWWSMSFWVAWLMVVNDDPMVWYYYIYGYTILPEVILLWVWNRLNPTVEGGAES